MFSHNVFFGFEELLYWCLMPLKQLWSYHGGWRCTGVSWLSHTSTNTTFFPKPPTTFLTCFCRGERWKYIRKKVCPIRVLNSEAPGHKSKMLTTEPLWRGWVWRKALLSHYHTMPHFDTLKIYSYGKYCGKRRNCLEQAISPFHTMFSTLYGTSYSF